MLCVDGLVIKSIILFAGHPPQGPLPDTIQPAGMPGQQQRAHSATGPACLVLQPADLGGKVGRPSLTTYACCTTDRIVVIQKGMKLAAVCCLVRCIIICTTNGSSAKVYAIRTLGLASFICS